MRLIAGRARDLRRVEWAPYVWTTPKPDLTLISYGMNDQTLSGRLRRRVSVEPERYGANIARIVELHVTAAATVSCSSHLRRPIPTGTERRAASPSIGTHFSFSASPSRTCSPSGTTHAG